MTQIGIYIGSVLLAPMGYVWGVRYLKEKEVKAKLVGVVAIALTTITLILVSKFLTEYIARVNEEVSRQLNGMQGF